MQYIDDRGSFISKAISGIIGNEVYSGPFKGMKLNTLVHAGNYAPYLLGTYEHELHPIIEKIVERNYKAILNVGCSFGYYAVGLAWLMPQSRISVLDIEDGIVRACLEAAALNKVRNVKQVEHFVPFQHDLIIMDCEGAEEEYLDPERFNFKTTDILVELHECNKAGLTQTVIDRFKDTHTVELIYNNPTAFDLRQIFGSKIRLEHFDNAICTYEGRAGETPWAMLTCK